MTNDALEDIKNDWMQLVDSENITQSSRYIRQKGLPVLRIYCLGFKAVNGTDMLQRSIMCFLLGAHQASGVIMILPWIHGANRSGWIYNSLDGIHQWHVGRWNTIGKFNSYNADIIIKDAAYCKAKGILYVPTMWPGFSWHNLKNLTSPINIIPRQGGNFFGSKLTHMQLTQTSLQFGWPRYMN